MDTHSILAELEYERNRLENTIRALQNGSGSRGHKPSGKRRLSAEARRKISLAQKKRWARVRKGS